MSAPASGQYGTGGPPAVCSECGHHAARCQFDDDREVTRCSYTGRPATVVRPDGAPVPALRPAPRPGMTRPERAARAGVPVQPRPEGSWGRQFDDAIAELDETIAARAAAEPLVLEEALELTPEVWAYLADRARSAGPGPTVHAISTDVHDSRTFRAGVPADRFTVSPCRGVWVFVGEGSTIRINVVRADSFWPDECRRIAAALTAAAAVADRKVQP